MAQICEETAHKMFIPLTPQTGKWWGGVTLFLLRKNLWNLACNILDSIWIYKPWAAVNRKAQLVFVLLPGGHARSPQCVSQLSLLRSKDRVQQRQWVLALWALPRVNFGSCPTSMPQSTLLCSQCGWECAGEIPKSSVLVREVSQWRTKEEKSINPHFSLDLLFASGSDWGTHLDLRHWNLLLKHPPLVIAGECAGITFLYWGAKKMKWLQLLKPPTNPCYVVQTTAASHKVIFKRCHQRRMSPISSSFWEE